MIVLFLITGASFFVFLYGVLFHVNKLTQSDVNSTSVKTTAKIITTMLSAIIIAATSLFWGYNADKIFNDEKTLYAQFKNNDEVLSIYKEADEDRYFYIQVNFANPLTPTYRVYVNEQEVLNLENMYNNIEISKDVFEQQHKDFVAQAKSK